MLRDNILESLRTKWNLQFGFLKTQVDPMLPEGVQDPNNPPILATGMSGINYHEMVSN